MLSPKIHWYVFLLFTSARNLLRSPRRTIISLSAIASAVAAIIVFQAFVNGVKTTFRHNVITSLFAHFQISPIGFRDEQGDSAFDFKISKMEELRKDVAALGPLVLFSRRQPFYGLINFDDRSVGGVGFGIDAEEESRFLTLTQAHEGMPLEKSGPESIVIGFKLAKRLRIKVGDMVSLLVTTATGSMNAVELEVVGTFKTGITELDQGTYHIHHDTALRLVRTEAAPLVLLGYDLKDEVPLLEPLRKLIREKYPDLEVAHWRQLAEFFDNTMGWIEKQVVVFRWIILLIASISIVNVFMMGLFERMGEFGTLRAVGTHRTSIALMIFFESVLQASLGSLLGLLGGVVVIQFFLQQGITMPPPPMMSVPFHVEFVMPWLQIPAILGVCILVCGGAGIYPAIKIARIRIVDALGRNL